MSSNSILLQNGTVVTHGAGNVPTWQLADILITGNVISKIGQGLPAPATATVIDCTDKVITPGLIDTHHHMWQTVLKGRFGDDFLKDFLLKGITDNITSQLKPEDVFIGSLSAALECLDAGTTSVVDFCNQITSAAHIESAARGLSLSGLRGIFATGPGLASANMTTAESFSPVWKSLSSGDGPLAHSNGRVSAGLSLDHALISPPKTKDLVSKLDPAPSFLTMHSQVNFETFENALGVGLVNKDGPPLLVAHAVGLEEPKVRKMLDFGAYFSATTSTELHLGIGDPICFDSRYKDFSSIGIDCHTLTTASLINEVRLGVAWWRGVQNELGTVRGEPRQGLPGGISLVDAFNLVTVNGAKAMGLSDRTGTLREGYLADIVVWDATSPSMIAGAQHDPIATLILHSSVRDIDTVIVDGVIRKKDGVLVPVELEGGERMTWPELARQTVKSRAEVQTRLDALAK